MSRTSIRGQLGGLEIGDDLPVRVMAVLNVSPESFYAGSVATATDEIARRAARHAADGADLIDVGAMGTAPYRSTAISEAEEADRLARAIVAVRSAVDLPISADTQRVRPASAAIEAGATIVNDISGLTDDRQLAGLVARSGVDLVLMARDLPPGRGSPIASVAGRLRQAIRRAVDAGVPPQAITIDPGIGFTTRAGLSPMAWNLRVLADLARLRRLGRPLLVGVSRKRFIGLILDQPQPDDRLVGSLAAAAIAVLNGAHVVRAHDPGATREAVQIAAAIRDASRFT